MNVFEAVRENGITARQAAEHCGIKINRSGMAVCPFRKDKNPSMKIDSRYYCFGCGEKGDAIDFVAKFYGLGKKEAALRIASDFGISFEDNRGRKPPPKRKRKMSGGFLCTEGVLHEQASGEVSAGCAGTVTLACLSWAVISAGGYYHVAGVYGLCSAAHDKGAENDDCHRERRGGQVTHRQSASCFAR